MVDALDAIAAQMRWQRESCYLWVDYQSIPQLSKEVQTLAIRTLPIFASLSSIFVIVPRRPCTRAPARSATSRRIADACGAAPSSSPSTATGASKISTRRRRKTAR